MRFAAFTLILLVVVSVGLVAYTWTNTALICNVPGVQVESAEKRQNEFLWCQAAMENNAVPGTVYQSSLAGEPTDYNIMTYKVNITNKCLLDAEMTEIQIVPIDGDIVCFSGGDTIGVNVPVNIPAMSTVSISCILITGAENHAVREFNVTYYIWGHPYSVRCTFG